MLETTPDRIRVPPTLPVPAGRGLVSLFTRGLSAARRQLGHGRIWRRLWLRPSELPAPIPVSKWRCIAIRSRISSLAVTYPSKAPGGGPPNRDGAAPSRALGHSDDDGLHRGERRPVTRRVGGRPAALSGVYPAEVGWLQDALPPVWNGLRAMGRCIGQVGTPARRPQPRGKAPRRAARATVKPATWHPVIRKGSKTKASTRKAPPKQAVQRE